MSHDDQYKAASDFKPLSGEANFPPPIETEVVGGMHIAPECITRTDGKFVMVVWPSGLPRHETTRTVRFPHGLMAFGETMEQCAQRLVGGQLGMTVKAVRVLHVDSYVDDANHWHLEPWLLVDVEGEAHPAREASGIVTFTGYDLPPDAVWGPESFRRLIDDYVKSW